MDVNDDRGAAPMLVEPRPAEDHRLQPMSDELDGDGAPSTEDGVLLLPRGLFDALDDDDVPPAPSDPRARTSWASSFVLFFPARPHVGAGRPVGSTPLRVRTVLFRAVMFPLHCYPHIVLLLTPRVVSFSPLSAHKEFAVDS